MTREIIPGQHHRFFCEPEYAATDEYAVMIDTRDALDVGPIEQIEWPGYVDSWKNV